MLQLIIYTRESNSLADEATLNEGEKAKKYLEQQEFFDPELADEECEKGICKSIFIHRSMILLLHVLVFADSTLAFFHQQCSAYA